MRKALLSFLGIVALAFVAGCSATPQAYVDEAIGLGYVQRIAVLPLQNNTQEKFVGERLRDVVTTELLGQGMFEVIEKGDVARFLRENVVGQEGSSLDLVTAQNLAKELKVQAYMAGSVDGWSMERNGSYSYPVIAATLRLVDAQTGKIIWQTTGSQSGYSSWDRLFGFASEDVNQVSFRLVHRLLDTLYGD